MKTAARKTLTAITFASTVLLLCVTTHAADKRNDPLRWEKQINRFLESDSKNSVPADAVLFVGSSSIRMWKTAEYFPSLKVINRGFGGSQISDVNHYADNIVMPYKPKAIVFYAGDNDIAAGKSPQTVYADYRKFIRFVRKNLDATPVIFISIKPSGARWHLYPEMKMVNDMIQKFSEKDPSLYFVDLSKILLKDGKPDDRLFIKDRLHHNKKGYKAWTKLIKPVIKKAIK